MTSIVGCSTGSFLIGFGTASRFNGPAGVTVNSAGTLYIGDGNNHRIRALSCVVCPAGSYCSTGIPILCPAGSFCPLGSTTPTPCAGGPFSKDPGSLSCEACPGGHYCPPGTSSWAGLNCGRGKWCAEGSAAPTPCPTQVVPPPYSSWAQHPLGSQGPAFLLETAACLNHCFWNFTSGDGLLSKC